MKKIVLFSLMMACLPLMVLAQSGNDDLYFIPKKKTEKKEKVTNPAKVVVEMENTSVSVNTAPGSSVIVVKDVNGNVRDVDEYNRRYTSRDNSFSFENDTLYIEEKPYNERGEWINGFEGSQTDYDYAMRIIRFRSPAFAIPISSPLYWDVISLGYSWEWNVFDTGMYAYAFPTNSNRWWWDWRFNYTWRYPSYWHNPSNYWCSPYYGWYGYSGYYWGGYYPPHIHHSHWHHFPPHYAHGGVGGYWGSGHGWNGSSAHNPGIHSGRYADNHRREPFPARRDQVGRTERNSRNDYVTTRRTGRNDQTVNRNSGNSIRSSSGRVVTSKDGTSSVRPQRSSAKARSGQAVSTATTNNRSSSVYTRQVQGRSSSYNRASSTRSTVTNSGSWNGRSGGIYNGGHSSSGGSGGGGSYSSSSHSSSSSASYSSGGSSGAGRSASNGGTSRGSGGRR